MCCGDAIVQITSAVMSLMSSTSYFSNYRTELTCEQLHLAGQYLTYKFKNFVCKVVYFHNLYSNLFKKSHDLKSIIYL